MAPGGLEMLVLQNTILPENVNRGFSFNLSGMLFGHYNFITHARKILHIPLNKIRVLRQNSRQCWALKRLKCIMCPHITANLLPLFNYTRHLGAFILRLATIKILHYLTTFSHVLARFLLRHSLGTPPQNAESKTTKYTPCCTNMLSPAH